MTNGEAGNAAILKAHDLFAQRRVVRTAQEDLKPERFREWLVPAIEIQSAIYRIDSYYEESAQIETRLESPLWGKVLQKLTDSEGAQNEDVWSAFTDLKGYADVERRIHSFDPINTLEFENILTLKCADVRIARALIWCYSQRGISKWERRFWTVYDECWELIEDLHDIYEDGRDWNFNFWLYTFMAGRSVVDGINAVNELLDRRMAILEQVYTSLPIEVRCAYLDALKETFTAANRARFLVRRVYLAIENGKVTPYCEQFRDVKADYGKNGFPLLVATGGK